MVVRLKRVLMATLNSYIWLLHATDGFAIATLFSAIAKCRPMTNGPICHMALYLHVIVSAVGITIEYLLDSGALLQTNIGSKTSNLAGNSLHTIFASDN